jgi:hypothetical protein
MGMMGCGNNDDIDKDICIFDVNNPIDDLEWLRNKIPTTTSPDYSIYHYLYQNKKNPRKYFFTISLGHRIVLQYSYKEIYDCNGDLLMMKAIEGPAPKGWDEFFEENTLIKQIWPIE